MKTPKEEIELKRVKSDINGNPRYVCHFLNLLNDKEKEDRPLNQSPIFKVIDAVSSRYELALRKARKIGGRKYNNKQYSGGIVFQSYNTADLIQSIIQTRNA